jgi:hypothetical protein
MTVDLRNASSNSSGILEIQTHTPCAREDARGATNYQRIRKKMISNGDEFEAYHFYISLDFSILFDYINEVCSVTMRYVLLYSFPCSFQAIANPAVTNTKNGVYERIYHPPRAWFQPGLATGFFVMPRISAIKRSHAAGDQVGCDSCCG